MHKPTDRDLGRARSDGAPRLPDPASAPAAPLAKRADTMTPTRNRTRELAERTSNGTLIRLIWLQGTLELWVEVYEPELDVTIVIPAQPEQALDAFHHPYAYAATHGDLPRATETLATYEGPGASGSGPALDR